MIKEVKHIVIENSQRDNISFEARSPGTQCFVTCDMMFMSFYTKHIKGDDDKQLAEFLTEIEIRIPGGSIAEEFYENNKNFPKSLPSSAYWDINVYGINKKFDEFNVDRFVRWSEVSYDKMKELLVDGPLIFGTKLTASGHIILLTGYNENGFYVNDPYGNYTSNYKDHRVSNFYDNSIIQKTGAMATGRKNSFRVAWAV